MLQKNPTIRSSRCHHAVNAVFSPLRNRVAGQLYGFDCGNVFATTAKRLLFHIRHFVHHFRYNLILVIAKKYYVYNFHWFLRRFNNADRPHHVHLHIQGGDRLQDATQIPIAATAVHVHLRSELFAVRDGLRVDGNRGRAECVFVHWAAASPFQGWTSCAEMFKAITSARWRDY